ncbi:phosphate signaling complex protein PhoU [Clostridium botulinum]|uniref:Phosphate-specific transport system accessory protein PhoU n=1 Tax=Clostridium botulinum (strain Hall / ATCC 3502 / NCTC 13319 / Type A) TaxID=441771 RepID=A5I4V2_CLOBH|nr:phosphate signaling complex protein PhoU [Clostridium botulinum]ABS34993.1 phosphate transport system regulatory protein PhoU [Clostridium botulinum A str. ATCC 19397]ABS36686.1 phosphate transport system regulatory protein PhoU [Clostridium botulinum A str. Hall]APQ73021.1 phosphate transport system regulatory protein PhoU [Clostridium botulinum]APQ98076.1 phosphate transport system regulatory protein PhoU [Clostridium botulinum]AUM88498.1 phosphate transport system regulatory protein PhoU
MRKVFDEELLKLHNSILRMGSIVEKQINTCIKALVEKDEKLADEVIKNDDVVDDLEKEIEDECIVLIAKEQPLATDLRKIFTTLKIVTDLERMADHAVDIAKIAKKIKDEKYVKSLIKIPRMADLVQNMIKESLDSYVNENKEGAYKACTLDDEIDHIYKTTFKESIDTMIERKESINQLTQFLFVCKYLERIADHATNICEWTIYLITGEHIDMNE